MLGLKRTLIVLLVLVAVLALLSCSSNGNGGSGGTALLRLDNKTEFPVTNLVVGGASFGTVPASDKSPLRQVPTGNLNVTWTWNGTDYSTLTPAIEPGTSIDVNYYGGNDWQYNLM